MVEPARTWTVSINNSYSSNTDRPTQYQEAVYNWALNMTAAGWTVTLSSDGDAAANTPGGGNAGAGNNWTAANVIGIDSTAGGGAWIVLQAPASFLQGGESLYVIGIVNDAAATPRIFQVRMSPTAYTGGTTTSLPTTAGPETGVITNGDELLPSAVGAGTWNSWRTTRGDTIFMIKETGVSEIESYIFIYSMDDASGGGVGGYRVVLGQEDGGILIRSGSTNFLSSNARSFNSAGTLAQSVVDMGHSLINISSEGTDINGELLLTTAHVFLDASGGIDYKGQLVDIYAAPAAGLPSDFFGLLDDAESGQTLRRVALGSMWFYVPTADLPFV